MCTFAVPFGNERVFNAQNRKARALKRSLKRLKGKYKKASTNERQFLL